MKKKDKKNIFGTILFIFVFVLYLLILWALLFCKKSDYRSLNLIPFASIGAYLKKDSLQMNSFAFLNIVGNVVLFLPLGIYLPALTKGKHLWWNCLWIMLISVLVEGLQWIFCVGASDIDDVILNTVGGALGVTIYQLLLLCFKDHKKVRTAVNILACSAAVLFILYIFLQN